MRRCLRRVAHPNEPVPTHFALAYDAWAPVNEEGDDAGKVPVKTAAVNGRPANDRFRERWLAALEGVAIHGDYVHAFRRWEQSLTQGGVTTRPIEFVSRLLVGRGNASATEVGLTVHHTWGVPMIPGSALKGLCAHYTAATYGTDGSGRTDFAGPTRDDTPRRRAIAAPGNYYRALFGALDVNDDASAGLIVFHDALYVPDSVPGNTPFAVDVLTVHQRSYYGQDKEQGTAAGERWPNDYDSPTPVGFISVKPGAKLLLAVGGDAQWAKLAMRLLPAAIQEWGAGGKTSAGYGRGRS